MGVQVTKSVGELAKRLKSGSLEPTMRKISKHLQSSAVGKICSGAKRYATHITRMPHLALSIVAKPFA